MKTKLNILMILVLLLVTIPGELPVQAQTTTADDPAADYMEWPEDEVFFVRPVNMSGTQMNNTMYLGKMSTDLVNISPIYAEQPNVSDGNEWYVASGHMLDPKKESVITATAVNQDVGVNFFQPRTYLTFGFLHYTDLFAATMGCSSFMDITTGDLDDSRDANYDYHDEAVLVYAVHSADNQLPVKVAVMDFTDSTEASPAPKAVTTATAGAKINTSGISSQAWKCADNALGVSAGDFDGNGIDEIAVAYQTSNAAYRLDIFRYSTAVDASGQKTHSLSLWQSTTQSFSGMYVSLDIAADDFDGDGRDEVAVAVSGYGGYKGEVDISIFSIPAPTGQIHRASLWVYLRIEVVPIRVQIASGLFGRPESMDDPADPDLSARQLAVAFTCQLYAGDDYRFCMKLVAFTEPDANDNSTWEERDIGISYGRFFWLEAGGFKGPRTSDDYYWTLAVGRWVGGPYSNNTYTYVLDIFHPSAPFILAHMGAGNRYWNAPAFKPPNRFPVVATDYDGDTVYLGAPMKLVMEEVYQYKMILQEPPKHAYWDKELQKVVTISRWDDFYVEFKEGADYDYKTSTKHETEHSYGLDEEVAIGVSKKFGGPLRRKELKGVAEGTFEQDWGDHYEGYNSLNETYSYEFSRETTRDDVVSAEVTYFEIWRYPAYGLQEPDANGNTLLGYMDIVMPSALPNITTSRGASTFDGWEPAWENGNILSYPIWDSACLTPADLGSFYVPCTEGEAGCEQVSEEPVVWKKEVHDVMAYGVLGSDAAGGTNEISMTKTEGSGEEQTYSGSMNENADIKGYYSGKIFAGIKLEVEAGFGFHDESSWADTNTTEDTTTTTRSLYLTSPAPTQVSESYVYAPVLYVTQDGVMKLGYCVDLPGSGVGKDTWLELYGDTYERHGKPDPALNLPYRFKATFSDQMKQNGWEPEPMEIYRDQMRGILVKEPELDPNVNDYLLLTHAPVAGEPMRLEVRVNNYSLSAANGMVNNLEVKFEATTIDPTTLEEITVPIGTAVIPSLLQREPQVAAINWTPPVIGFPGQTLLWRVHVTLDPDNKIDEIYDSDDPATYCLHESCTAEELIDPGQNNYGFRELSIVNPSGFSDPFQHQQRDIHFEGDAMLALNRNGRFDSGTTQVYLGSRVPVRVQVTTDKTSLLGSMVRLYEGDPQDGGTLLAEHRVMPGLLGSSGNVAWFLYTPMDLGPHTLYAVVSESSDDLQPGNNIASLKVVVIKAPKGPDK